MLLPLPGLPCSHSTESRVACLQDWYVGFSSIQSPVLGRRCAFLVETPAKSSSGFVRNMALRASSALISPGRRQLRPHLCMPVHLNALFSTTIGGIRYIERPRVLTSLRRLSFPLRIGVHRHDLSADSYVGRIIGCTIPVQSEMVAWKPLARHTLQTR